MIVIPAILLVLLIVVVTFLRYLLTPSRTVLEREPTRYDMYDAGNPPVKKTARRRLSMQYLGYLIMFLAVEPAVVLFALLTVAPQHVYDRVVIAFAIMVAVYAPLLAYALREARHIESWSL